MMFKVDVVNYIFKFILSMQKQLVNSMAPLLSKTNVMHILGQ